MSSNIKDIYRIILDHLEVCEIRFKEINKPTDFNTPEGTILLDAISMRLQASAEKIKKAVEKNKSLINKYPNIEWEEIIRFRDFISHHYELLDYEIIFAICKLHLPKLKMAIQQELKS